MHRPVHFCFWTEELMNSSSAWSWGRYLIPCLAKDYHQARVSQALRFRLEKGR